MVHKFCEIAAEVSGGEVNIIKACPDIVVGCNGEFYFSKERRQQISSEELCIDNYASYKTIVVVLESPHKDEYAVSNGIYPSPAIGKTGTKLQEFFNQTRIFTNVNSISEKEDYRVVLMNTIQYQCSLGVKTSRFRDEIWGRLFAENDVVDNFIGRLRSYNPNVIFNGCTKGANGIRRKKVTKVICDNFDNIELFEMNHPCSWRRSENDVYNKIIRVI